MLTALTISIAACGGGTDDADAPPSTTTPQSDTTPVSTTTPVTDAVTDADEPPATTSAATTTIADTPATTVDAPDPAEPPSATTMGFGDQLEAGDCFDDTIDEQGDFDFSGVPQIVDCDDPHDNEVAHVRVLDDEAGAPYPPDEMWDDFFDDVCAPTITGYLGIDGPPSALNGYFVRPDEDEWAAGSRSVPCIIYLPDAQLVGSVQGVGNDVLPAGFPADAPLPDGIELSGANTIEESYAPSEDFAEEAGIDTSGFRSATFEGGDIETVKPTLEGTFASAGWDVVLDDHWSSGVATAFYAVERDGARMIVEIWELTDGDSRVHYFYPPA